MIINEDPKTEWSLKSLLLGAVWSGSSLFVRTIIFQKQQKKKKGIKTFSMLNPPKHETYPPNKYPNTNNLNHRA